MTRATPTPKPTATQRRQAALNAEAQALGFDTWRKAETAVMRGRARLVLMTWNNNPNDPAERERHAARLLAQRNRNARTARANSREGDRKIP